MEFCVRVGSPNSLWENSNKNNADHSFEGGADRQTGLEAD